jgi:hypothetical protein
MRNAQRVKTREQLEGDILSQQTRRLGEWREEENELLFSLSASSS